MKHRERPVDKEVELTQGQIFVEPNVSNVVPSHTVAFARCSALLVRCRRGLSHHPDEFVALADISAALQVTVEFLASRG
jgi:acetylornithine deacetylase/succinyl-diaminopimelate desuccinylase-like protein